MAEENKQPEQNKLAKASENLKKFGDKADKAGNNMMQFGCGMILLIVIVIFLIKFLF